jgi:hypothetical protein
MKTRTIPILFAMAVCCALLLGACEQPTSETAGTAAPGTVTESVAPPEATSTVTATPTATQTPTATPLALGPDTFSEGIDPLTGLPAANPEWLLLPPSLVSISDFPEFVRPQAGLDYSDWVFEAYIGQGMTRFLALFYGNYPTAGSTAQESNGFEPIIGPIRSGRVWYEDLRKLFNGFLVMASGSSNVTAQLENYYNAFSSDNEDAHNLIPVTELLSISQSTTLKSDPSYLVGNKFDLNPPAGGKQGLSLWVRWSLLNQEIWRYDPASGAYNRYQNDTQTGATFTEMIDRLTGFPLTYENVIVLFADHYAHSETVIEIELLGATGPALLFRDGQEYQLQWTTMAGEYERSTYRYRPIRFVDADGNPFPLKPGQTWVIIVPGYCPYYETVDSEDILAMLNQQVPGSGHWALVFTPPAY